MIKRKHQEKIKRDVEVEKYGKSTRGIRESDNFKESTVIIVILSIKAETPKSMPQFLAGKS